MDTPVLLLTRPAASSVRFAVTLDPKIASQAELLISPLLEIVPIDVQIQMDGFASAIFTSTNGVAQAPKGNGLSAYCVGHKTAAAAQAKGWHIIQEAQDADHLVDLITSDSSGPLLHLSGTHQRGDIAERVSEKGVPTQRLMVYDQKLVPLTQAAQNALCGERRVVLPLFSPRTAAYLVKQAPEMSAVTAIAMSAAVADQLEGKDVSKLHILAQPTGAEMAQAVELLLSGDRLA